MQASGTCYLRGAPIRVLVPARAAGQPSHGWELLVGWREDGGGQRSGVATWRGPDADAFMAAHPHLKAGDCVELTLHRLRARSDIFLGTVLRCELAPPRWPGAAAARCAATESLAAH